MEKEGRISKILKEQKKNICKNMPNSLLSSSPSPPLILTEGTSKYPIM